MNRNRFWPSFSSQRLRAHPSESNDQNDEEKREQKSERRNTGSPPSSYAQATEGQVARMTKEDRDGERGLLFLKQLAHHWRRHTPMAIGVINI